MASSLIFVLPIFLGSAYMQLQQQQECLGKKHPYPIAENLCSGLRLSLNESCSALLSVPLGTPYIQLNLGQTVRTVKFDDFTKTTIKATYSACTDFWDNKIDYREYRGQLSANASVLNLLYAQLPQPKEKERTDGQNQLIANGASVLPGDSAEVRKAVDNNCAASAACGPSAPRLPPESPTPGKGLDAEIAKLRSEVDELSRKLAGLTDARIRQIVVDELNKNKSVTVPVPLDINLIVEARFKTGKDNLPAPACQRARDQLRMRWDQKSLVYITGHADSTGASVPNQQLSTRRAESMARCLSTGDYGIPVNQLHVMGEGVLTTLPNELQFARKVSVYIPTPQL